jgi:hypothetical protein
MKNLKWAMVGLVAILTVSYFFLKRSPPLRSVEAEHGVHGVVESDSINWSDSSGTRRVIPAQEEVAIEAVDKTTVRVWFPDGSSATGAEVWSLEVEGDRRLGVTSLDGSLALDAPPTDLHGIQATLLGWKSLSQTGYSSENGDWNLTLSRARNLRGVVTLPSGEPCGEGVWVFAAEKGRTLDWVACSQPEKRCLALRNLARTNQLGEFEFTHLEDLKDAAIVAGGLGLVTVRTVRVEQTAQWVDVPVQFGYAGLVRFRDPIGGVPVVSEALRTGFGAVVKNTGVMHGAVQAGVPLGFILAGFKGKEVPYDYRVDQPVLVGSHVALTSFPGIQLTASYPGYEQAVQLIELPRVSAEAEPIEIDLGFPLRGFGGLRVHFKSATGSPLGTATAVLELFAQPGPTYLFDLRLLDGEPVEVFEIPQGNYGLKVRLGNGLCRVPDVYQPIEIGSGVSESVVVVPDLGEVQLKPSNQGGQAFDGRLIVSLCELSNLATDGNGIVMNHVANFTLDSSPYTIAGIPNGDYVGRILSPPQDGVFYFSVDSVSTAEVEILIDR